MHIPSKFFPVPCLFAPKAQKGIVRVGDRRDLVVINRMCVYEVRVYNRTSVISEIEKWLDFCREGEISTFEGEISTKLREKCRHLRENVST